MKMKRNLLFVPFVAVLTLLMVSVSSASELASDLETSFNGVDLDSYTVMSGMTGNTVPVKVTFTALEDMSEVRVHIRMEGHREEVSTSTARFDIVDGVTYTKLLNLRLPSDEKDLTREYTLYVEISSAKDRTEEEYTIQMQRESYQLDILAIDCNSLVSAGEVVPVTVVVKNTGYNDADDVFITASIPSLDLSARTYVGELVSTDEDDEDDEVSVSKTLYIKVPENAQGTYELEVSVYNLDSKTSAKKLISVSESGAVSVLTAVKNKDLKAGETVTYELILINSGENVKAFNIKEVSGSDLTVSVPSIVVVGPHSSETVSIVVTASDSASIGTYTFTIEVEGKQTVFGANVIGTSVSNSVVALTVILVIVFIVLLAVLIILLTRKEKPIEEVETSYY
ncbi:MAG: hypothetical protein WC494_00595 [Candidatus Pacearchaeota archaeon]